MSAADNPNQCSKNIDTGTTKSGVPEGRLASNYKNAVARTLDKFLKSIKYSEFKAKYPEIYQAYGEVFKDVHTQLISQLRTTIAADLEALSTETSVYSSLTYLDDLITNQNGRVDLNSWRPTGNPEDDVRDHLHHRKQKHKKCLEFVLETLRAETDKLEEIVEQNHAEIMTIKKEIHDAEQDLQKDFNFISDVDTRKLSQDFHVVFGKH